MASVDEEKPAMGVPFEHSSIDFNYVDGGMETSQVGSNKSVQRTQQQLRQEAMAKEIATLANSETKAVGILRAIILLLLLITTALVSAGVYGFVSQSEQDDFRAAFEIHAKKIIESFHGTMEQRLGALGTLSDSITIHAREFNETFPFVTLADFAVRGAQARVKSDALTVHWIPIVTDEKRLEWEEYAFANRFQIDSAFEQDLALREDQDELLGLGGGEESGAFRLPQEENADPNILQDGTGYHKRIFKTTGNQTVEADGTGPYAPLWQRSPISPQKQKSLNMNFATAPVFRGVLQNLMKDPRSVIINKLTVPTPFGQKKLIANLKVGQYRHNVDQYVEDPFSFIAYPVFDSFDSDTKQLKGMIAANLYWRVFFSDVLSDKARGVIVVLDNSYNQTVAYRIDGSDVTFLGEGDPHDPTYDDMVVWEATARSQGNPEMRAYTTASLSEKYGLFTLRVFPSKETEAEYTSNMPVIYTITVACIFVVTSAVFLLFNYMVERRQRVVMTRAAQSGALVSSLFPEQVKDRLYANNQQHERHSESKTTTWTSEITKVIGMDGVCNTSATGMSEEQTNNKQIADLYDSVTIMFADLAGFTEWSSNRSPSDVFDLLESLYGAFDAIAVKRRVFKVETIGDCYLAACGLPEPNDNHAVVMAKFSRDCMVKMNEITRRVSCRLGADTCNLQFRVGLHSGSVTAGILRGQKARFQLFGDTVNTASRMESTGQPGRIHVSKQTADELCAKGKDLWVRPRQDKVLAKGKGELQTFWVTVSSESSQLGTESQRSSKSSTNSFSSSYLKIPSGLGRVDLNQDKEWGTTSQGMEQIKEESTRAA